MSVVLFNHGLFQDELNEKLKELHSLKQSESDPYKQWNYSEQIKLIEDILIKYKESVNTQLKR